MKLTRYVAIGGFKQSLVILVQVFLLKTLSVNFSKTDFDLYTLILGVFAISNSFYSVVLNADSIFIISKEKIGQFRTIIWHSFLSIVALSLFLTMSYFIFGKSGYIALSNQGLCFIAPLLTVMLLDGPLNRYLFLQAIRKNWYNIWLFEIFRPLMLLLLVLVYSVKSLQILLFVYLGLAIVQTIYMIAINAFEKTDINDHFQKIRILGFSVGSIHYSLEKEWMDTTLYSLLPIGLFGSFGVLIQVAALFKALNRLFNRYFMKDILDSFSESDFLAVINLSIRYVVLLSLPLVFGLVLFELFGGGVFQLMNVDILPLKIIRLFFLLMFVEALGNPLTTLMLGVRKVYILNLILLTILLLARYMFRIVDSVQYFMGIFVLVKLVMICIGYTYLILNRKCEEQL